MAKINPANCVAIVNQASNAEQNTSNSGNIPHTFYLDFVNSSILWVNDLTGDIEDSIYSNIQSVQAVVNLPDADAIISPTQLVADGVISMALNTAARTLTTSTATQLNTYFGGAPIPGYSFTFSILNQGQWPITLAGGTGVSIVGDPVINNGVSTFKAIFAGGAYTIYNITKQNTVQTNVVTPLADAPATPSIGQMINGIFTMTPGAGRTFTTPIAADIINGMSNKAVGTSFDFTIISLAAFAVTVTAGDGNVTIVGDAAANNNSATFACVIDSATTVVIYRK